MILGYSVPAVVSDELRELEQQVPADVAPLAGDRASCACGEVILLENEHALPDPLDELRLHTPALCYLLDDEEVGP